MKKFLPIFILFVSISTYAQNYRTANTFETNYYEDSINSEVANFPFKTDNFNVQNGDTLISFLEIFNPQFSQSAPCIDTASTPWQGEKVLLKLDGTDIYYNENNEPITIETQANIGDTWLLFDENIKIEATLSQIMNQNIFGVVDSVKTFTLQVFDSLNNPISHILNGETYQFSKNYGFVSAPDFYYFPSTMKHDLTGIQNTRLGIYNITRNDIYDFEIGDEFHIREGTIFSGHYYKVIILTKQLDADNNWEYTYNVPRHIFAGYNFDIDADTAIELSGTVPLQLLPQAVISPFHLPNVFHQYSSGFSTFNTFEKSRYNNRNQKRFDTGFWQNFNNCWSVAFISGSQKDTYIEGLGGPYGGSSSGSGITAFLVYYKKGNETYGTPVDFDLLMPTKSVINKSENLKIYPNPAQDFINIELKNITKLDFNILIINNLGQVVQQDILTQNVQQIPVNHLPKGIYVLQIRKEETIYVKRFVKE